MSRARDLTLLISNNALFASGGNVGIGTTIPQGTLQIGTGVTFNSNGNAIYSGILTATTFSGNHSGGTISGSSLSNYVETTYAFGNTGTNPTLALSNGNFVTATLDSSATFVFSLTSTPAASGTFSFTLALTNDATAGRTIVWPTSVVWPGGTVPTRTTTANKTDIYTFFTINNGTTWYGNLAQYNY